MRTLSSTSPPPQRQQFLGKEKEGKEDAAEWHFHSIPGRTIRLWTVTPYGVAPAQCELVRGPWRAVWACATGIDTDDPRGGGGIGEEKRTRLEWHFLNS